MSDSGQKIHGELQPEFGVLVDDIDKATGGALSDASDWITQATMDFLDSYIGKIIIATIAGVVTGGVGAAILGPTLATLSFVIPAAALGEVKFFSGFVAILDDYTKNPVINSFLGASEAVGNDAKRALEVLANERGKPKEVAQALAELNALYGPGRLYTVSPAEFSKMYAEKVRQIQGPNYQTAETPAQLSARLGIREDAAALAIGVWNGSMPDMTGYDPETGKRLTNLAFKSGLGGKAAAVQHFVSGLSAKSGKSSAIVSGVKATTMAAQTAQPKPPPAALASVQPIPFYKTETVHKVAPIGIGGLGLGGALLMGLGAPIAAAVALGAGGATYLLTRKTT